MFLRITACRSFEHIRDYVSSTTRGPRMQHNKESLLRQLYVPIVATDLAYLATILLQLYFFLSIYIESLVHNTCANRRQSFSLITDSLGPVNEKSIISG